MSLLLGSYAGLIHSLDVSTVMKPCWQRRRVHLMREAAEFNFKKGPKVRFMVKGYQNLTDLTRKRWLTDSWLRQVAGHFPSFRQLLDKSLEASEWIARNPTWR